jgi:hypothetical protein
MEFKQPKETEILFAKLILLKVARITVEFSGSGDSGQIDGISAENAADGEVDIKSHQIAWDEPKQEFIHTPNQNDQWVNTVNNHLMPLDTIVEMLCNDALEESGLDWYNNDGGQGSFTIDLTTDPPSARLNVGINHTETDDHSFEMEARKRKGDPHASSPPRANKRKDLGRPAI